MSTPIEERPQPTYVLPHIDMSVTTPGGEQEEAEALPSLPSYNINNQRRSMEEHRQESHDKSSDGEGTVVGETEHGNASQAHLKENVQPAATGRGRSNSHLTVRTEYEYEPGDPLRSMYSPSQTREQASRMGDDLEMLKVERQISRIAEEEALSRTKSGTSNEEDEMFRSRSRKRDERVDEFDVATNPVHEKAAIYKPVEHPSSGFSRFIKRIHSSNWLVRYVFYIAPFTLILLIPLLLGSLVYKTAVVGDVYLGWFMIWLEIVWLSLWAGRILAKCLPWPIGLVSSLFTNNSKKWRDMGKQLELPATLFFWWLAIEVSFLPTMTNHRRDGKGTEHWMKIMNKVLVALFVGVILNFVEKIIIQLIAISFHLRTYADRIEINKFQIGSLAKLYKFSKEKIAEEDCDFEAPSGQPGSGARTPGQLVTDTAKATKEAFTKFGDIAGKVAGDFTGKQTTKSTHPNQVVLALIGTTTGAQVLARRLYRTFAREETQTVYSEDLKNAFDNEEEAEAAFNMFDKDMNGDISMEELEAVCVEIGRERKSITASLKDLDSVISQLDDVFMFLVLVITVLVFISLISTSAAGVLTSAGSTVLGLSWLFSATAQEFLQSVLFVFVKHPFDVGDRVGIYGNTGALGRGDDYFVKELSLLYTEFKKMEGHVVQAPNSYLNTLFILNQRRSGGLAEAVTISIKFGTTLEQIEGLRNKLLDFVRAEKREFQGNILTELRDIVDVHSMNMNIVFFYKSNWQNEGLRLARRNKFICAMMVSMQELGIEGPYMRFPGLKQSFPMYLQNVPHVQVPGMGHSGHPDAPSGIDPNAPQEQQDNQDPPFVAPIPGQEDTTGSQAPFQRLRSGSILRAPGRPRGESLSQMNKRVDFSLGARDAAVGNLAGDVYSGREQERFNIERIEEAASQSRERKEARDSQERASREMARSTSRDMPFTPGNLARRSTDSSGHFRQATHRNRFFGRGPRPGTGDDALLEGGQLADIQEQENPSTSGSGAQSQVRSNERIDPRSGMVSPAAWWLNTDQSNLHPAPAASGALQDGTNVPAGHRRIGRSQTEDFEMRRMR